MLPNYSSQYKQQAELVLRQQSARATRDRVRVLAILLSNTEPQTHHSIDFRLAQEAPIDRVTLYRVLEWLTDVGLVRRFSGEDRVWRFSLENKAHSTHAHFHCTQCGDIACLNDVQIPAVQLPQHLKQHDIDLTVRGHCNQCRQTSPPNIHTS